MRAIQVIILAAGSGTRMKSELPKVLHPVCGRPMIAYALDLAAATGGKPPIVILGGETAEAVKPHLPKDAVVVVQKTPLGTGDAVMQAKKHVGLTGDVLVLYADTLLIRRTTIQRLIESHYKSSATCTMLTAHLADPSGYGRIVRDPAGIITGIVEEADANAAQRAIREINVGPIVIKAQPLFEALANVKPSSVKKEWYLTQAVAVLGAREGGAKFQTARVEEASEALGVNSRAELVRAGGIIRQRILEMHLHNGVTIVDPATTYIDQGVTIGHDTVINPCTVIETGVSVGKRCSIGPFARLRHGTAVSDDTRIGNFAELVRTKVGQHVRMLHMSYLGDATVEDDVNIGAGTITANYDGKNKLPTMIGKGAFIGSDTILIAPVKVGAGAVTGAGSVVPKDHDVPARGTVFGVPARAIDSDGEHDGKAAEPAKSNGAKPAAASKPAKPAAKKSAARPAVKRALSAKRRPLVKAKAARRPKVRKAVKPASRAKAKPRPKAKAKSRSRR